MSPRATTVMLRASEDTPSVPLSVKLCRRTGVTARLVWPSSSTVGKVGLSLERVSAVGLPVKDHESCEPAPTTTCAGCASNEVIANAPVVAPVEPEELVELPAVLVAVVLEPAVAPAVVVEPVEVLVLEPLEEVELEPVRPDEPTAVPEPAPDAALVPAVVVSQLASQAAGAL